MPVEKAVSESPLRSNQSSGVVAPSLTERQRQILRFVVREYVASGRPIGSRALAARTGLGVSPATIRSEMAALEELGYLQHLHTSGGRIPTDQGYRYFVANLMGDFELPSSERQSILQQFREAELQLDRWI